MFEFSSFLSWFYWAAGAYAGSFLFFLLSRQRVAVAFIAAGLLPHTVGILERSRHLGTFTPLNLFSELYFLPWLLALAVLFLSASQGISRTTLSLILPLCFFTALDVLLPVTITSPSPLSSTAFAPAFFCTEVMAHALFIMAGWQAFLFLSGRTEELSFNRYAVWGFIVYSISQVLGAVWSCLGWSLPFHWGERHFITAAIWCFYCAYLHLQFSNRWSAQGKARMALAGALIMFVATYAYYLEELGAKHG